MRHRIGHRAMPERPDQPPLAVHRQIARGPYRGQTDVAGEDGVLRSLVADRLGDLLRVDRFATGLADREPIEILARFAVMFRCTGEMSAVTLLADERQHSFNSRANVAHHAEIDRRAAADLFGPHIHLCDAYSCTARIELAIRKIGTEHQEDVAIEHGIVTRREPDQPGHADVERVVPLDMLLASERVHDRGLQAISQREDFIMCALTSRAAQYGHTAIAIEKRREPIDIRACRHCDGLARKQARHLWWWRVRGGLKCDVARNYHDRDTTIAYRLPDRDFEDAWHLVGARNQFTIMTAFLEQDL